MAQAWLVRQNIAFAFFAYIWRCSLARACAARKLSRCCSTKGTVTVVLSSGGAAIRLHGSIVSRPSIAMLGVTPVTLCLVARLQENIWQHRSDGDLGCARVIWSGPPVSPIAERHQWKCSGSSESMWARRKLVCNQQGYKTRRSNITHCVHRKSRESHGQSQRSRRRNIGTRNKNKQPAICGWHRHNRSRYLLAYGTIGEGFRNDVCDWPRVPNCAFWLTVSAYIINVIGPSPQTLQRVTMFLGWESVIN